MNAISTSVKKQSSSNRVKTLCSLYGKPTPELEQETVLDSVPEVDVEVETEVETEVAEKKPKKPFLSAKYSKFMVFGYWLIENLNKKDLISDLDEAYKQIEMFSEVPDQIALYKNFVDDEFKVAQKAMKTLVRNHQKELKQQEKKEAKAKAKVEVVGVEKKKRGRKAKPQPLPDEQEQLIADLVAAAQGSDEELVEVPVEVVEKPKRKYNRKAKEDAVVESGESSAESGTESGAEKPKRKSNKKTKPVDVVEPVVEESKTKKTKKSKPVVEPEPVVVVVEPEPVVEPVDVETDERSESDKRRIKRLLSYSSKLGLGPNFEQYGETSNECVLTHSVVEEPETKEEGEIEEGEEDELEVTRITIKGVEYLLDEKQNQLFDPETYEPIRRLKKGEKYETV